MEMDRDILVVAEGLESQTQEYSQEEQAEVEGQWVGEDILVSQERPEGQSTAC